MGDEDQSIYGFRAAEPGALLRFERDYPGGRVLFLEKNYRSTQTIVTAADGFIRQNHNRRDKHMTAARGPGPALEELWVYEPGGAVCLSGPSGPGLPTGDRCFIPKQ